MVTAHSKPPTKPVAPPADTSTWLRRTEAADLLGVGENTILNWQKNGLLHPVKAMRKCMDGRLTDVWLYDPRELARAPVKRINGRAPGDIAARAFEMFDNGDSQRAVVIATRELPEKIEELHDKWLDMGGADFVITPDAKRELERMFGRFESVAALISAARRLMPIVIGDEP